ncbi:hypothetical protein [Sinorhizobium fredii]|uniref:Cell envelope integrity protein TolA n=1 Tax=Rhizobium fredii TaxID=380 RepID=A0A2A6LTH8_RHIFR|nr:hypothetical protein [Sinorhizobium fredii]ASY67824.1 hypothetical protein SF83666_c03810 [Sinorhizobium fredii CCBAU 83666]AWI56084.1 hypothetical protein AB395_0000403 [Sinorhizobium fredii CCBAU 45436]AWM23710.1 hypothetical protein AOX55_0000430 [Sinorhizobium fredii CCBAU 25509]KSV85532.1 hypothetical protein N181_23040 [Sinorhizobium fredii USDA 205]MCG5476120.1 hypothetical protein [Sinorhizobium fredii]
MKVVIGLAAASLFVAVAADPLRAEPLQSVEEVSTALGQCWTPPAGIRDSFVTLKFGFRGNGTLMGPPQPTAIRVTGDADQRKAFVAAATAALQNCMPLEFSPELAEEIAGNVFTLQFYSAD